MIARIWHGWTTQDNARAYERLLREEVLLEIARRNIPGYNGGELFVCNDGEEVEFITLLRFDSLDAVKTFAGEDYEKPVMHPDARRFLKRFNERSRHYQIVPLN